MKIESILQQEFIHCSASLVSFTALGNAIFAISLWVNVIAAARQENPMRTEEQPGNAIRTLVKRDENRGYAGGVESGKIGRQRTLVIG